MRSFGRRTNVKDAADVQKVREALHGKAIRVGTDLVGIQVSNDLADAQSLLASSGNVAGGVAR